MDASQLRERSYRDSGKARIARKENVASGRSDAQMLGDRDYTQPQPDESRLAVQVPKVREKVLKTQVREIKGVI